jgi:hypothetical protein
MKIALLADSHFGCRNDSPAFIEYQNRFLDELFFPYLQENNITTLVHLGDVVDRRKFINFQVAHNFQKKFWKKLWDLKIDTHIIIGNHDTYYKNTNDINSAEQLLTSFDGINEPWIYTKPKTVNFDGLDILILPWICDATIEESIHAIDDSTAQICMGHLEIKGFEMNRGHLNEHGLEREQFKRFEKVISGHFHRKSDDGHIYYLGTPYEITWSDYKCPKGFHIFDTTTRELTRIPNPLRIHKKLIYNDKIEDYSKKDLTQFTNTFVKLIISNKTNIEMFNKLVDRFHTEINVHELNIIEDLSNDINTSVKENILDQGEDTLTFLGNYVDQIDTKLDRQKLKKYIKELYTEANE